MKEKFELNENDVHISYLPMPHIFEKALFATAAICGFKIGVFSGDVKKLLEDI